MNTKQKVDITSMNVNDKVDRQEHRRRFWVTYYSAVRKKNVITIPLTKEMTDEAENWAKQVIEAKKKESHHKTDGHQELKRWSTGALGEIVLGKYLGVNIHDKGIGKSTSYNVPDLEVLGLRCGVKTFNVNNFPLTNRLSLSTSYPQIFIAVCTQYKKAYIFGMADVEDLKMNERNPETNLFVKDSNALKRKVAFIALDSLKTFKTLDDLKKLVSASEGKQLLDSNVI